MGKDTKIEWSTHRFNPWWSCTKVSEACSDCYAWRDSIRWGWDIWGPGKGRRTFGEANWREPVKWNKKAEEEGTRHRVFCCSMGDVFEDHADLASERGKLWPLIEKTTSLD